MPAHKSSFLSLMVKGLYNLASGFPTVFSTIPLHFSNQQGQHMTRADAICFPVLSPPVSLSVYQKFTSLSSAKSVKLTRCPHSWVVSDDMTPSSIFSVCYMLSQILG